MREAALVMQAMELEEEQEEELLSRVEQQIQEVRARALGPETPIGSTPCPGCSVEVSPAQSICPDCGKQLADQTSGPQINMETAGE